MFNRGASLPICNSCERKRNGEIPLPPGIVSTHRLLLEHMETGTMFEEWKLFKEFPLYSQSGKLYIQTQQGYMKEITPAHVRSYMEGRASIVAQVPGKVFKPLDFNSECVISRFLSGSTLQTKRYDFSPYAAF